MTYIALIIIIASFFHAPTPARAAFLTKAPNNLSLVGYWNLDDNRGTTASDLSGNGNNGTINGNPAWTNGKRGKALDLDGSGDFVELSANPITSNTWTLSMWFNIVASDQYDMLYSGADNVDIQLFFNASTKYLTTSVENNEQATTFKISDHYNEWHHVVWTHSGSNQTIVYIDGVSVLDTTDTTYTNNGETIRFGQVVSGSSYYIDGVLDDIRVYSRALSPAEASAMYRSGQITRKAVSENGLIGFWPLDDGRGQTVSDASGVSSAGTINSTASWISGKRAGALSLNGSSNYVNLGSTPTLSSAVTISAWVYKNANVAWASILDRFGGDNSDCVSLGFDNVDGKKLMFMSNGSSPTWNRVTANSDVPTGQWVHVAASSNGSNVTFYVNGVADGTQSTFAPCNTGSFYIGVNFPGGDEYLNAKVDDVRLYNRALSATEIAALYKQNETVANAGTNSRITNGLVGLWSFNGYDLNMASTTAEILDRSGNSNNGDNSGGRADAGRIGQGWSFDGSSNYISVPDVSSLQLTSAGTVSVWINPTAYAPASGWRVVVSKGNWAGGLNNYSIYYQNSGTYLRFEVDSAASTQATTFDQALTPLNTWSHIAMTWDGTTIRSYLNGVQQGTAPMTGNPTTTSGNFYIGSPSGGASFFQGNLDEVRVYNRALSADEVKQLYNMGK